MLAGGAGGDVLFGDNGSDTLSGGAGPDELYGGAGNDEMSGGTGVDLMEGGEGDDTLGGDDGRDTLFGGAGNDELDGGNGDDSLEGDDGDDIVDGGTGEDSLSIADALFATGGTGADTFSLDYTDFASLTNTPEITDFTPAGADADVLVVEVAEALEDATVEITAAADGAQIINLRAGTELLPLVRLSVGSATVTADNVSVVVSDAEVADDPIAVPDPVVPTVAA